MKQFLMAVLLVVVFVATANAGDIPSVNTPTPPPPGGISTSGTTPGEIPTDCIADQLSTEALSALLAAIGSLTV